VSCYITCEADLDFPVPNVERMLFHVRRLFDGAAPVTTEAVARLIGCDPLAVDNVLKRAAHSGLIREVRGEGWIPLAT
jgi:hypothetical protein